MTHANVHVQVNECSLSPLKTATPPRRRSIHTPKKILRPRLPVMNVEIVPGRTKSNNAASVAKTTGRCKVCNIIYESKADKDFRKRVQENLMDRMR